MMEKWQLEQWHFIALTILVVVALFFAIMLFLEIGRRIGLRKIAEHGPEAHTSAGGLDGTVSALLALLIGFSFSAAGARFDKRRDLIIDEVEAIKVAWERIDILPPDDQPAVRQGVRDYLDQIIAAKASPPGTERSVQARMKAAQIQEVIWAAAVASVLSPEGEHARQLVLPGFNDMFQQVDAERLTQRIHQPIAIFIMLCITALAAALYAGYGLAPVKTRRMHMVGAAATIAIIAFVIIELESPRYGLIRVDATDHELVELRATMD